MTRSDGSILALFGPFSPFAVHFSPFGPLQPFLVPSKPFYDPKTALLAFFGDFFCGNHNRRSAKGGLSDIWNKFLAKFLLATG